MKKIILTILAITILTMGGLAFAQGWGRGAGVGMSQGPCFFGNYPGAAVAGFNLTPEQTQKMQALREVHWKEVAPLQNELMNKRLELRSLWLQPNPDQERILAKQKEINALTEKIQEKATKHRLDMRQILTPDQQAKLGGAFGAFGTGPGFGRKGGFGPGRGMGYGPCYW